MVTKEDVLSAIRRLGAASATAISKELGYSKKNDSVSAFIDELYDDEVITEVDDDSAFVKYQISEVNSNVVEDDEEMSTFDPDSVNIPVDSRGYEISQNSKGFKIVAPDGNKYQISKTQRILVINNTKKYLVFQPEDILFAIEEFTKKHQIQYYIIKDLSVGRSVSAEDINLNPCIVFVQVEEHNKAGR